MLIDQVDELLGNAFIVKFADALCKRHRCRPTASAYQIRTRRPTRQAAKTATDKFNFSVYVYS
jgi:hypothetical protein